MKARWRLMGTRYTSDRIDPETGRALVSHERRSGRGATVNRSSTRFNLPIREMDGDWLDEREAIDGKLAPLRTSVTLENARTIISRNKSPDIHFDQSVNAYRGCEHGCIFCYARPTHAFLDLSPGIDFESKLFAKPAAAKLLVRELANPNYRCEPLAMGTNTDPYQPIEANHRITRELLEVLAEAQHPVMITTKSDRILRDLDILAPMARDGLVVVTISITTLDVSVSRTLEPRAPHPERRFKAVRALCDARVPTWVSISPIIPHITDHEIERMVARAAMSGARGVRASPIRLPNEVAPLFRAWLDQYYPDRAAKVMATIKSLRGGKDNDSTFFSRFLGEGPWSDLMQTRLKIAKRKHSLVGARFEFRTDLFRRPLADGQLRLL